MNKPVAPATPALDPVTVAPRSGSGYPAPYRDAVAKREKRALGDALGLSHFGVNLVRLPPGTASAQRHWHSAEDEFVYILEGEVELVTDAGAQRLTAGMQRAFPPAVPTAISSSTARPMTCSISRSATARSATRWIIPASIFACSIATAVISLLIRTERRGRPCRGRSPGSRQLVRPAPLT